MEPYDKITPITPSSQLDINTEFIISIQDRYYKLSKQAFLLVLCLSHGEDMDSAITSYQKKSGSSYSRKQISYVIENAINPIDAHLFINFPTRGYLRSSFISIRLVVSGIKCLSI